MSDGIRIDRVYFQPTAQLGRGPGSALIRDFLSATLGMRMCLALIDRPDGKFTLILDNEWIGLGFRIRNLEAGATLAEDFEIPRPAMKAVIAGWPSDWDADESPTLSTHYSADNIPHLSLNGSELGAHAPAAIWIDEPPTRITNK